MHPPDRESLLLAGLHDEVWSGESLNGLALRAAALARRRQRRRRALQFATVAAGCCVMLVLTRTLQTTWTSIARPALPPAQTSDSGYEIISDQQLLAQLNDRSLLLIHEDNGARELVLLPTKAAEESP